MRRTWRFFRPLGLLKISVDAGSNYVKIRIQCYTYTHISTHAHIYMCVYICHVYVYIGVCVNWLNVHQILNSSNISSVQDLENVQVLGSWRIRENCEESEEPSGSSELSSIWWIFRSWRIQKTLKVRLWFESTTWIRWRFWKYEESSCSEHSELFNIIQMFRNSQWHGCSSDLEDYWTLMLMRFRITWRFWFVCPYMYGYAYTYLCICIHTHICIYVHIYVIYIATIILLYIYIFVYVYTLKILESEEFSCSGSSKLFNIMHMCRNSQWHGCSSDIEDYWTIMLMWFRITWRWWCMCPCMYGYVYTCIYIYI